MIHYFIEEIILLCKYLPIPLPVLEQELETEKRIYELESQISLKMYEMGNTAGSEEYFKYKKTSFHKIQVIKKARICRLEWLLNTKEQHGDSNGIAWRKTQN